MRLGIRRIVVIGLVGNLSALFASYGGSAHALTTASAPTLTHASTAPKWSATAHWADSWDAASAVTYKEGKTLRVQSVPDASGGFPLLRDKGAFAAAYFLPGPLPGPRYLASSRYFNGRPALFADKVAGSASFPFESMLSPNVVPDDPSNWFAPPKGYPAPYWVAVLGRATATSGTGLLDSVNGGVGDSPTLGNGFPPNTHKWSISTFGPKPFPYPSTRHPISPNETILIIAEVAPGPNASFIELDWRDRKGVMHRLHQAVTLNPHSAKTLFVGYVHEEYVTAVGIATGAPTVSELAAVRSWAARYTPPASAS